jgi:hypothetical protein
MNYEYKLIILTLLIVFVASCNNNKSDITNPYEIDESLGYFPLKVENSWYYKSEQSYEEKVKITSQYELNNNQYHIMSTLGEHSYPDTVRFENNIVWKIFGDTEIVWFDFNLVDGEQYQYKTYNVRVETGIIVQTYYGEFTNCIGFYFDVPGIADEEVGYVFAKGVGVVRIPGAWVDLKLHSFVINN